MKAITFTIDLKSFFLGVLTVSAVLLMANKPNTELAQQNQSGWPNQRYQAITGKDTRTIIIDTQTGRFLIERPALGLPAWAPMDFEELYRRR
ncbi:hypothetical protein [Spirosoma sp. KUDC1026]|uniref:hypothetical protein n=1 Tax=Spirosoma sp. KUDC1026 TaxID=2745947 RepID=UPI00159BD331|nr:hypothetical protein [Spirosoma sp. KUDC1026]QKZ12216.1 hypothetical protein HU175_06085 [Spirosoma sp. KUDC1026]